MPHPRCVARIPDIDDSMEFGDEQGFGIYLVSPSEGDFNNRRLGKLFDFLRELLLVSVAA